MQNNPEYGYVKFTGDYSKLKGMGFTFQKLFANNYMQWHKDHFRVWKKGAELEHDRVNLFKLIMFLRTEPITRSRNDGKSISFFKFYSNADENIYDYYPTDEANIQRYRENMELWSGDNYDEDNPPPYLGESVYISMDIIHQLKEFHDMGWYELAYYPED